MSYKDWLKDDVLSLDFNHITDQKYNYIFSQKILTNTGVRDLLIRMLCVAIQVNYYDKYMNNKYKYISFIHDFIDMFNFDIEKEKTHAFDKNSLYKQLKEIDIKNPDQTYAGTFLELNVDCLNKDFVRTEPFILKWQSYGISYNKMKEFCEKQLQKSIELSRTW